MTIRNVLNINSYFDPILIIETFRRELNNETCRQNVSRKGYIIAASAVHLDVKK